MLILVGVFSSVNAQSPADQAVENPEKTEASSTYPSRDMRNKELLAKTIKDEGIWLDTPNDKILGLYRPTEAKETKGVLLLLHAAENPQTWPSHLENLRSNLPKYGWETLAITLPQKYFPQPPTRELTTLEGASDEKSEENSENTQPAVQKETPPIIPRDQLVKEYMDAAIKFINDKGHDRFILLVDNSAVYLGMQYLSPQIKDSTNSKSTVEGPLKALIVINMQPQEFLTKEELEVTFNQKQLPTMDVFFAPDNEIQKKQRLLHHAVAMRNKSNYYRQSLIELQPKTTEQDTASFWLSHIRGFMQQKILEAEDKKIR